MANYNIDIAVALKGAKKLTAFNKDVRTTQLQVEGLNKTLKNVAKDQNLLVKSFQNLNSVLSQAKGNFNAVASGTFKQITAAKQLITAEKELNKEISLRNKLLTGGKSAQGIGLAVDPVLKSIQRNQRKRKPIQSTSSGFKEFSQDASEILLQGQTSPVGARIDKILANRKKSEKEIQKIRETAGKKREIKEKRLIELRKRSEKLIAQDRERTILARGRIGSNIPSIGNLVGGLRGQFREGGAFAATGGQRARGALSNALIGGGFPLLFGQGALGAAGGGIGGAAGGALGGGFGFGLSIAGTALAQRIQESIDFRKSVAELNKEMERMGITSNISSRNVIDLGKSLGITKQEAVQTLQEFKRFGKDAVLFAEKFKGDFGKFEAVSGATDIESTLAAIKKFNKDLTLEEELRFIRSLRIKGAERTINDLLTDSLDKQKQLETKGFGQGEGLNPGANRKRKSVLDQEKEATQDIIDKNTELTEKLINVRDLNRQIKEESIMASISISETMKDLNFEMKKLNDRQFQVIEFSKAMGASFEESFKGIIKGTMSVGDAFRNMLNRMADHFLDMAAKMLATQFQRGILSLIGNSLTGGLGGGGSVPFITDNVFNTEFDTSLISAGAFKPKAMGGPVKGGGSYIVGEKGPELFTPGVSGMVTPNHALGGTTNVVVNVDASGNQQIQGNDDSAAKLGEVIAAAVQAEIVNQQMAGGLLS